MPLQHRLDLRPLSLKLTLVQLSVHLELFVHELRHFLGSPVTNEVRLVHHVEVWAPERAFTLAVMVQKEDGEKQLLSVRVDVPEEVEVVRNELA